MQMSLSLLLLTRTLSDINVAERKRKLSETSSATSSSNKRANGEQYTGNSNSLNQTDDKNDQNGIVVCDDQFTEAPTKIKIALKSKSKRKSATDVTLSKVINKCHNVLVALM